MAGRVFLKGLVNGERKKLSDLGLAGESITQVWRVDDEVKMWGANKPNPLTGREVVVGRDLDELLFEEGHGVFMEYKTWQVTKGSFSLCSSAIAEGEPIDVVLVAI